MFLCFLVFVWGGFKKKKERGRETDQCFSVVFLLVPRSMSRVDLLLRFPKFRGISIYFLAVDSPFCNHRSFQKPAFSPGFLMVSKKREPWKEWKWKVALDIWVAWRADWGSALFHDRRSVPGAPPDCFGGLDVGIEVGKWSE